MPDYEILPEEMQTMRPRPTSGTQLTELEVTVASGVDAGANGSDTHILKRRDSGETPKQEAATMATDPIPAAAPAQPVLPHMTINIHNAPERTQKGADRQSTAKMDEESLAAAQTLVNGVIAKLQGATPEDFAGVLEWSIGKLNTALTLVAAPAAPDEPPVEAPQEEPLPEEMAFSTKAAEALELRLKAAEDAIAKAAEERGAIVAALEAMAGIQAPPTADPANADLEN